MKELLSQKILQLKIGDGTYSLTVNSDSGTVVIH